LCLLFFFFSSRRRHTRFSRDWSSDVCSSDLDDIELQRINIANARRGYYNRPSEVIGMAAKRRIRAGQTITPALLEQAMAVKRGQPVKIVASQDGIEASTSGEALSDGLPDEIIRVRNVRSGKVIDAKVVEEGVVTSTF